MASNVTRRLFSTTARRMADGSLKAESKRNPETLVRSILSLLIGLAQSSFLVSRHGSLYHGFAPDGQTPIKKTGLRFGWLSH